MLRIRSSRRVTWCSLALLPLFASSQEERARWAPDAEVPIEWSWRTESEHVLERVYIVWDRGLSTERQTPFHDARVEVRDVLEVRARDRILERDEVDPLRLERELVRARSSTCSDWGLLESTGEEDTLETVSPLEGERLVFEWDARAARAVAEFDEGAGSVALEEHLEALDEGLDLRGLLGGVPRAPGDRWQLDEEALRRLVRPGGELALAAPEADFDGEHDTAAFGWLLGAVLVAGTGHAWGRAEYVRATWEGERRVARITLHATIESRGSVREALERLVDSLGSGGIWLEYGARIEVEHRLEVEGVLLWDLEAGRAHSLELDGRSEASLELGLDLGEDFASLELDYVAELRGKQHLSVSATAVK